MKTIFRYLLHYESPQIIFENDMLCLIKNGRKQKSQKNSTHTHTIAKEFEPAFHVYFVNVECMLDDDFDM